MSSDKVVYKQAQGQKTPVQVSQDRHYVEYKSPSGNVTVIELPKPVEEMTQADWSRMAFGKNSPLANVQIDNYSFNGLNVVLKDSTKLPQWLYWGNQRNQIPSVYDPLDRAKQMGAVLVSSLDEILTPKHFILAADGHIHVQDVVLAAVPAAAYWAVQYQNVRKANSAIEYQSAEGKAYENIDMPHYIKGNREVPVYQATEHSVQYQDRPRF